MKTYEEMTRSVMEKAQIRRSAQRRRNGMLGFTAIGVCCVMLSLALLDTPDDPQNLHVTLQQLPSGTATATPSEEKEGVARVLPRHLLLCAGAENDTPKVMEENIKVPYNAELRVRDVAGMTAEERKAVIEEEDAYIHRLLGENADESGWSRYCRDNVIITMIQQGSISIAFDDIETVANARISVTQNGYIFYPRISGLKYTQWDETGLTVEVNGDALRKGLAMLEKDNFEMYWQFATGVADQIDADPNMDLSQLSDRITVEIAYTDGRVEVSTICVEVDSTGKVNAVLEETRISA